MPSSVTSPALTRAVAPRARCYSGPAGQPAGLPAGKPAGPQLTHPRTRTRDMDELARLIAESGPHCDALQSVLRACNEADGHLFSVGRAFMRSAYKPPLPFLNYRRVASMLVEDLHSLPDVYSDESMFDEALRKAVEAEIRSAMKASQTGLAPVVSQAPLGPLPPSISQRYEAASAILGPQPGHRTQAAGSECSDMLLAACNTAGAQGASKESSRGVDETTRQSVLADYLSRGVVQRRASQTRSGSSAASPVFATPLPADAKVSAASVMATPYPGAPPSQPPPSFPPSACGSTPSNASVPSTISSSGNPEPTTATQKERAASPARSRDGPILEDSAGGLDFESTEQSGDKKGLERSMGELHVNGVGGMDRKPVYAGGGRPIPGGTLPVVTQLIQLGVPSEALGAHVDWFDYRPEADRRSASIQPARRTIAELQAAFLHRELRRHRHIPVEPCAFTAQKLATALKYGSGQKRLFASSRGKLHVDLMEWRYELASRDGSLTSAMETMISVFASAVHSVAALDTVEEEVDTLARHGVSTDEVFFKMLRVAEYELLPSGDSDDSIFLLVTWHPNSTDIHSVRTAFGLLTKLRSLAVSNQQGEHDELILRYFRVHVEKARMLSSLVLDSTRRSLPSLIYEAYLTTERRGTYNTVAKLARALKEPSSIGTSSLLFTSLDDSHA